ncbi:carbohydrate-binding module family 67 protein [Amanita thiersii Skay4041]|uniref:Carbohydrate-binding module family 67 protein n=1 Tax=Amanita thiersii Skay4041 TaxID=703135 RepID=A0A2A9N8V7_9AGAR|nr:carbohydrate-binding module family 67 protein [Amanita thiersii Skay4041]
MFTNATLDFTGANGSRKFPTPADKKAVCAEILITTDNDMVLYVNGNKIGTGDNYQISLRYCVRLDPVLNVFAVRGYNQWGPTGVLAAIQITFADGSATSFVTDTAWLANAVVPGFEAPSFDDSQWPPAVIQQNAGNPPLGIISPMDANGNAPIGRCTFRRTFYLPNGLSATSGIILISADNDYTLYVNGKMIGSGNNWQSVQCWVFDLPQPLTDLLIAVYAKTDGGQAGIIVAARFDMHDYKCSSSITLVSDASWKYSTVEFEQPGFDDSAWATATIEGPYGKSP